MRDRQDDYEPIIAPRRPREPRQEEATPLWRTVLAVGAVFAGIILLAWWWTNRPSSDEGTASAQQTPAAPEALPESHVEQEVIPPARDAGTPAEVPQQPAQSANAPQPKAAPEPEAAAPTEPEAATPPEPTVQSTPEVAPANGSEPTASPSSISVRFTSPDPQVKFELSRGPDEVPFLTGNAGDTVEVPPGTYRVTASGAQLERLEREVTFEGRPALEYAVELCAQRKYDSENLAGRLVEERKCSSATECQTMFSILSEYADELVRQRDFRMEQCAKWRPGATPGPEWTLNIECDGAMPETTCRIEIGAGECSHPQPLRSARGGACPRAEIK
jgi:uncharacterized membrane protein